FFASRRRHTRFSRDWSSDVCSSDLFRRVVAWQKFLAFLGRATIFAGILWWPLFAVGAVILGVSKIIDNMEIGHNVLHGQWDWLKIGRAAWRVREYVACGPSRFAGEG